MAGLTTHLPRWVRSSGRNLLQRAQNALPAFGKDMVRFRCNICGSIERSPKSELTREAASCKSCFASVRLRAIVHLLSVELFGESYTLQELPVAKQFKGIGLSDWETYAAPLAEKLDYTNTYYHTEPRLDICDVDPARYGTLDFLVSTDVYEHVPPPVQVAFDNTFKLLKPGGVFIFSVPFVNEGTTKEHFPDLHEFSIEKENEDYVLKNRTRDGQDQEFRDLVFHGGAGSTLEMRVFSRSDLKQHFVKAGFDSPIVCGQDHLPFGIHWPQQWSLPWIVRKPA